MCELFALSASAPVDIKLSLGELALRGGGTGIHSDGWGVAFLEGRDARVFRDPAAAARSPWVECLQAHPLRSSTVVAHIRHATRGAIELANTQPFARELWGRIHVFAHNGNLAGFEPDIRIPSRFQPIGETDSEAAFCELLGRLSTCLVPDRSTTASDELQTFSAFASTMRRLGPANIIYASNGKILAHADRRTQRPGMIAPPGLWLLERRCAGEPHSQIKGAGFELTSDRPLVVTLLASVPLTAEAWRPLPLGSVVMLEDGAVRMVSSIDREEIA